MLKVEGDDVAARLVAEEDMLAANVVSEQRLWELIYMPSHRCGDMRAKKLSQMLSTGDDDAQASAKRLFNTLLMSGKADAKVVGVMMKHVCRDSNEIRRLITKADEVGGIKPNTIM